MILVSAPAGFGKTTLVRDCLDYHEINCGWLSLDDEDNDPARFMAYLVEALRVIDLRLGEGLASLLRTPQCPPLPVLMTMLLNDLHGVVENFTLVIDDYHRIRRREIHDALFTLIEHQPPQMRLILLTRSDPPWSLGRLRARGMIQELRADHLKFTHDEAHSFLNMTMALDLDPGAVVTLVDRTEGWIAGLQLAALALRDHANPHGFIAGFSGSHRYIIDYLVEEVLRQQSPARRDFLRQTAILDRLTAPLCDAVTGRDNSHDVLDALDRDNVFLVSLDDRCEWYRYHHLFRQFLSTELPQAQVADLHLRAAYWYESAGLPEQAVRHAFASDDQHTAGDMINRAFDTLLKNGEITLLMQWFEALPRGVKHANPELAVKCGWVQAFNGRMASAEACCLRQLPLDIPAHVRSRQSSLRGYIALRRRAFQAAHDFALQGLDQLDEHDNGYLRSYLLFVLGEAQCVVAHTRAAIATLHESNATAERNGNLLIAAGTMGNLALHINLCAQRSKALTVCRSGLQRYVNGYGTPLPVTNLLHVAMGLLLYEGDDLDGAMRYLQRAEALSQTMRLRWAVIYARILVARVHATHGDSQAALHILERARELASEIGMTGYQYAVDAATADVHLRAGNLNAARHWLAQAELPPVGELDPLRQTRALTHARVMIAAGEVVEAETLLRKLDRVALQLGRDRLRITILLLRALCHPANSQAALDHMREALRLAAPEHYIRAFRDESPALLANLPALRSIAPDFVDALLDKSAKDDILPPVVALSEREVEILTLIAEGLSNKQIAEQLVLTLSTVKSHNNHIFTKLGVRRRTQAVARARSLGMI